MRGDAVDAPRRPRPPRRARPRRPRPSRRRGSGRRTAGSRARGGARARRPGSPSASWRAAAAIAAASGRAGLHEHAAAARARGPARPASWAISANVRSSARKSGKRSVRSASSTTPSVTSGKSWPLATICVPSSSPAGAARKRASSSGTASLAPAVSASRRKTGTSSPSRSSCSIRSVPAPWRATDSEPQASQRSGTRSRWPQWWQAIAPSARCRTSATSQLRALPRLAAGAAGEEVRPAAAVEQHDRLARARQRAARLGVQRVARAAHVEHAHGRQRARVDAVGQRAGAAARATSPGAAWRCRTSSRGAGAARALGGDGARVVARVALVLVGGVVLLVDDDQAEVGDRREHGRARADRDPRLAACAGAATRRSARPRRARSAAARRCRRSAPGSARRSAA